MLIVKIHESRGQKLLAACDSELAGKLITDGKVQLDLRSKFYAGEPMAESAFKAIASNANMLNLVGPRAVALGKELGLVGNAIMVKNIPHAQCVNLKPAP